jgi:TnpA family transposase
MASGHSRETEGTFPFSSRPEATYSYQAVLELGKVRKTIFLCEYLNSEALLEQESEEGLNVVENWNSTNDFIWYSKGGEIATNNREQQEIAILSLHLLQICLVYTLSRDFVGHIVNLPLSFVA